MNARGVFNIKKEHAEAVVKLMNKHQIRPQVGEGFEWEDAKDAFKNRWTGMLWEKL
jgi:hypothetical protein